MELCRDIYKIVKENLSQILALRNTGQLKEDNTLVSEGDLFCEKLMFDYLNQNVPNCMIISEETKCDPTKIEKVEYVITIDPIDGTENFVSGLKEWGFGISVYRNMKHEQSMLALPELDICLCTGDKLEKITNSRICGLSSYMTAQDFERIVNGMEFRIMGCCMYNMYNVIKGSYRQFQHLKGCYSWDILPGLNLALEHGLKPIVEQKEYKGEFLKPDLKYTFKIINCKI
jgi:myo-inositol-1(or 4)-monophosphatase